MNFSGKYEVTLWYGKDYPAYSINAELTFLMEIEEQDNSFFGIAHDTGGVGTSPDEAEVIGVINENIIKFKKKYKRLHYSDGEGNTIISDRHEGSPIIYKGVFNAETGCYSGTWTYLAIRRYLFFFSKVVESGAGTFELKKMDY